MNHPEYIDELIALVLAGEANEIELKELENWKKQSSENQQYFKQMALLFQQASKVKNSKDFSVDEAWEKVKNQTTQNNSGSETKIKKLFTPLVGIAAGLILLLGFSWFAWQQLNETPANLVAQITLASKDSIVTKQLPDGSEISLNKNSHLVYGDDFNQKERKLILSGEAYFKASHNTAKPFSVWVDELQILDIGTEFNIQALPQSDSVIVDVNEGSVSMNFEGQKPILLKKGERGIYYKKEKSMKKMLNTDRNSLAWKDKIFVFENTELHTVLTMLNDLFHVQIILENPELEKCRLNAQFNNESVEEMVEIIAATFNLKVTKTERSILLDGKSCGIE